MAKVKFSVYADDEVKKLLEHEAQEEERSLAYITARALRFYYENKNKQIIEEKTTLDVACDNDVISMPDVDMNDMPGLD